MVVMVTMVVVMVVVPNTIGVRRLALRLER
jgi:hypothetical protein